MNKEIEDDIAFDEDNQPVGVYLYGNKRVQSLVEGHQINGQKIQFLDAYNQMVIDNVAGTIRTTYNSSSMHFITIPHGYVDSKKKEKMDHSGTIQLIKTDLFGKKYLQTYRIRKLTPRECFRLMGLNEIDISHIRTSGVCKTQQYKLAGNSIVVDVMVHIFYRLFKNRLYGELSNIYIEEEGSNGDAKIELVGQTNSSQNSRIIDPKGISFAMANGHKDGMPKIVEPL